MEKEIKEKKQKEFEKLTTSELLNIEIDTLGDFELGAYFLELYNREPFDTLTNQIHELEKNVEELKRLLRSHKHSSDGKAVTDIDI